MSGHLGIMIQRILGKDYTLPKILKLVFKSLMLLGFQLIQNFYKKINYNKLEFKANNTLPNLTLKKILKY